MVVFRLFSISLLFVCFVFVCLGLFFEGGGGGGLSVVCLLCGGFPPVSRIALY